MQVKGHVEPVYGVAGLFVAWLLEVLKDLSSGQKSRRPETERSDEEGRSCHSQRRPHVTFTKVRVTASDE